MKTATDELVGVPGQAGLGSPALTIARSGTPLLSKSATAIPVGLQTERVADVLKEPFACPRLILTVLLAALEIAMSASPSPLKSPAMPRGEGSTGVNDGGLSCRFTVELPKEALPSWKLPAVWSRNDSEPVIGKTPLALTLPVSVYGEFWDATRLTVVGAPEVGLTVTGCAADVLPP